MLCSCWPLLLSESRLAVDMEDMVVDMVGMEGMVDMVEDTVDMAEVMEDTVVTEMVDTVDMVATEVTDMDIRKGKPFRAIIDQTVGRLRLCYYQC